jgi:hypothetical protein
MPTEYELSSERGLHKSLLPELERLGFKSQSVLRFIRRVGDWQQVIVLPGAKSGKYRRFTCRLGVGSKSLADLLNEPPLKNDLVVLNTPIHFLIGNRRFFEWEYVDEESSIKAIGDCVSALTTYALPHFNQLSSYAGLESAISNDASKLFVQSPSRCRLVLAAISIVRGDNDGAWRTLQELRMMNPELGPILDRDISALEKIVRTRSAS